MPKVAAALGLAGLALLFGCSSGTVNGPMTAATTPVTPAALGVHGLVHGGQNPVSGAVIQLWAVGTTAYGAGATALIGSTLTTSDGSNTTDSNANAGNMNNALAAGYFTISGQYSCAGNPLVYLTATGGNPGLGGSVNNSAIVLMAPLGLCNTLSSSTNIVINEVTTVASAYALTQFMGTGGAIGSPSSTATALASAFSNVKNLVNISTGTALTTTSGGNTVPQSEIDSLADILVPCVNTNSPTSSACSTLFSAATPSGGSAPATVLAAALDVALNPGNNVSSLYTIATANTAFQPTLGSAPGDWNIVVSGGGSSNCGYSGGGYTVSGTVNYTGTQTGQIYLALDNTSNCGGGTIGTSISSKGAYTIRGVPPGTYTLNSFMDIHTLGYGVQNAADPSGSSSVTVGSSNLTGQNVSLVDPGTITLTSAPTLSGASPFNTGAVVFFKGITNSGVEAATSYTLQWSTTNSFSTIAGSQTFPAVGSHGSNLWVVNGQNNPSLTNGSVYYFRAYGTSGGTPISSYSSIVGPITIDPPSSGSTVSGAVTFSGTAAGPMYVGVYSEYTQAVYAEYIQSPASMQAYSIVVPNNSTAVYKSFAIIDQNNDGVVDWGDIQDVAYSDGSGGVSPISVTGTTSNVNIALPSGNSLVTMNTQNYQSGSYDINFELNDLVKLPVAVTLEASSNSDGANVVGPTDVALCGQTGTSCGHGFQMNFGLGTTAPAVGDTYFFNVKYSDGTSETLPASVSAVLTAFATGLAPTTGTSTTPTFTWNAPVCGLCSTYLYQFYINPTSGNQGSIWEVPGNADGLPYTTTSLVWGTDPTNAGNTPSVGSLTVGSNYLWAVIVVDANNNQAITQVNYQP
jgi:hypothetical protein